MRKIWRYLNAHLKEDFRLSEYVPTFVLLAIGLALNYTFDFEDSILDEQTGVVKFVGYYLFYSVPFYLTLLFHVSSKQNYWRERSFWVRTQFALAVLSLDGSVPFLSDVISHYVPEELHYWMYKVAVNGISLFTVFLPLVLFYWIHDKHSKNMYGLSAGRFDVRPYLIMLLIMLPILISASFHKSFLHQYPMYDTSEAHIYLGVPEWVTILGYELAYGFDFITLEFLFRGFLVIGLSAVVGRRAVLAMSVVYCFLHFGKPAGEAISSIFGGYILGVIALESRSVWGGIIVHMGIAWLMELIGFIQQTL